MNRIVLVLCGLAVVGAIGWVTLGPGRPVTFKERVDEVASSLRCPVCESLSVKDSTADVAQEMYRRIEDGMRAGRAPEEIKAAFVESYGESVLLEPEPEGVNLLAWAVPVVALAGGGALAVSVVRRWTAVEGGRA